MKLCIDLFVLCMWYCWTGWPLYVPPAVIFFLPSSSISFCSNKGMYYVVFSCSLSGWKNYKRRNTVQLESWFQQFPASTFFLCWHVRTLDSRSTCDKNSQTYAFSFFLNRDLSAFAWTFKMDGQAASVRKENQRLSIFEFNGLLPLYIRSDT